MRIKGGVNAKKKHNRVLKLAKGYRGARSKQYRVAKQSVMRALTESYKGRKERKRQFRQLWIARINAAARLNVRIKVRRHRHEQKDVIRSSYCRSGWIQGTLRCS